VRSRRRCCLVKRFLILGAARVIAFAPFSSGAKFRCGGTLSKVGNTWMARIVGRVEEALLRSRDWLANVVPRLLGQRFQSFTYMCTVSAKSPNSNGSKSASAMRITAVPPVCASARP